jgi:signal transduction histidine kinase
MELLTNSSGWLAVTLSPETLVTALSPGTEGFAEYTGREMVGCPVTKFLADKTVFEMPQILDAVKKEGKWEGEIVYRDRHGRGIRTQGSIILLSDDESRHSGYLLLSRLTQPENLADATGSIYADIGSRVRALVHDLNNPLAAVMGSTQLLALNVHCTGKIRLDVEKLYSELEKIVQVVEKLHGYAFSLCERVSNPAPEENPVRKRA